VFTTGINFPFGLGVDIPGNIYIADYGANAILKETIQNDGTYVQSTVLSGFINPPTSVAVDSAGNFYIGLNYQNGANSTLIKETLQPDGTYILSYIGNLASVYGIAVDASGNVYATNVLGAGFVSKFIPSGNTYTETVIYTSPGVLAGLALDASGNLFVPDEYGNVIHELTPSGNPTTTTAYTVTDFTIGAGVTAFGIAVDPFGDLYVANTSGDLRLETPNGSGYTETVLVSSLNAPFGVTVSPSGAVFFDHAGGVDKFEVASVSVGTLPVKTTTSAFTFNYTIQAGAVVGAIKVVSQGVINTQSGAPEFVNASGSTCSVQTYSTLTNCSVNVTFTPQFPGLRTGAVQFLDGSGNVLSNLYFTGIGQAPMAGFSPGTTSALNVTGLGVTPLNGPRGPVVDAAGNLFVADSGNNRILKIAPGGAATVLNTPGFALSTPTSVAIDGAGSVYIADSGNGRVVKRTAQGVASVLNASSLALSANYGVAVDGQGNVYTSDATNNRVLVFPTVGAPRVLSTTGVTLGSVYGVAVDSNGAVFIADRTNSQIVEVRGGTATVLGTGSLSPALLNPEAVNMDAVGNAYVSDSGNNRIVEIPAGTTNGQVVKTGSGTLSIPLGTAVGNLEDLYICNANSNSITVSSQGVAPSLTFGETPPGQVSSDSPQLVTLSNLGNLPLTFSVPASGTNPLISSNFTLSNLSSCPSVGSSGSETSLGPGNSCSFDIQFAPLTTGVISGSLVLTDNNLTVAGSTQAISLGGQGQPPVSALAFATPPPATLKAGEDAGSAITVDELNASNSILTTGTDLITLVVTGPGGYWQSYTATAVAGVATFSLSAAQLSRAGSYTYTASFSTLTTAASETVNAGSAANLSGSGTATSGQSQSVGAQYTLPFAVTVTDTFGNPVQGATVLYSVPNAGSSAVLSAFSVVTDSAGTASVTGTANSLAGSFSVTATAAGVSGSIVFPVTNAKGVSSTVFTALPASPILYGSAQTTLTSTVSSAGGSPSGTVVFSNNSTAIGSPVSLVSGTAAHSSYLTPGAYNFSAAYSGDANFLQSASSSILYTVSKAPVTITPLGSQSVPALSTTSTLNVTLTGASAGAGILAPGSAGGSTVSCTFYSGATQLGGSYAGAVTPGTTNSSAACLVPPAVTNNVGPYTVTVTFNGDANYSASIGGGGGSGNSLSFPFNVQQVTPTLTWTPPASLTNVTYGPMLAGVLTAGVSYSGSSIPGTFTYSATPTGGSAMAVNGATILAPGVYALTVTFTPTDTTTYKSTTATVIYTVNPATPSLVLVSAANPTYTLATVSYTATITGTATTPSGTVTFYDGAASLGSSVLNPAGIASLAAAPQVSGAHSISAVYNGSAFYTTATSNTVTQLAQDFNVSVSTGGSGAATVNPGGTATYSLVLSPLNGATFPSAVTLTSTGGPAGATITLSPTAVSGGAGATTLTLTVATTKDLVSNSPEGLGRKFAPLSLAVLLLPLLGFRRGRKAWRRYLSVLLLLAGSFAAISGMSGCGGTPSGYFGQAPKTFTITVVGSAGTLTHSTSVTLTIE
jgi:sugar lactone lactonase YvrE